MFMYSARLEIEALRSLSDGFVRIESVDLLSVVFQGWLRVHMHVDRDAYPSQRPLCFVECEADAVDGSLEDAIALTERLEWEPTLRTPLHHFVQQLVSELCAMVSMVSPTLPPVSANAPNDLHAGAQGSGGEGSDEEDDYTEGADDELIFDESFEAPTLASFGALVDSGEGEPGPKRVKPGAVKVDEYLIYQRYGKARPPGPAGNASGGAAGISGAAGTFVHNVYSREA
ncbi:hypothetical protein T492DRAFT_846981 [Pavlovales sp. CCMP2436]|nr:hypothetical protein T492DRAFT_846981 [Pavlovales sp. CCMP2436]